jgi:hypothetical protein
VLELLKTAGRLLPRDFRRHPRKFGALEDIVALCFIFGWMVRHPGVLDLFWWLR